MIYGLIAAVGWGLADFFGAVVGRRIGSLWTVIVAQTFTAIVATGIVLASGDPVRPVTTVLGAVALNAVFSATAYVTHYKALELGPVAVVSPIGATYALVGVVLAIVVLGERPNAAVLIGGIITILGVMLTSTDLQKLRAGIRHRPPGLPWATRVGGRVRRRRVPPGLPRARAGLGGRPVGVPLRAARRVPVVGLYRRDELRGHFPVGAWLAAAIGVGLADLLGVTAFSIGAHAGFVSIVLVASAVFPLIAVTLSIGYLGERPVPNQYVGVALTVVGLLVLGLGA